MAGSGDGIDIQPAPPIDKPLVTDKELNSLIEDALDTVLPGAGSDLDEADNDFDEGDDEKPQLTSEGTVIPKTKIVVLQQSTLSDALKKKAAKKRSSHASLYKKVDGFITL